MSVSAGGVAGRTDEPSVRSTFQDATEDPEVDRVDECAEMFPDIVSGELGNAAREIFDGIREIAEQLPSMGIE